MDSEFITLRPVLLPSPGLLPPGTVLPSGYCGTSTQSTLVAAVSARLLEVSDPAEVLGPYPLKGLKLWSGTTPLVAAEWCRWGWSHSEMREWHAKYLHLQGFEAYVIALTGTNTDNFYSVRPFNTRLLESAVTLTRLLRATYPEFPLAESVRWMQSGWALPDATALAQGGASLERVNEGVNAGLRGLDLLLMYGREEIPIEWMLKYAEGRA